MAVSNFASMSALIKELYLDTDTVVQNVRLKAGPLYNMLKKQEITDAGGIDVAFPITIYGGSSGASATFATAQANAQGLQSVKFQLTRSNEYGYVLLDRQTMMATTGLPEAFVQQKTAEIEGMMITVNNEIAFGLYSDGTAQRGTISTGSTVASSTITLSDITQSVNFESGMWVVAASATGVALRNAGAAVQLTGVQQSGTNKGQLTVSGNWNAAIPAIATSDVLFRQGDVTSAGVSLKFPGLQSWVPFTPPGGSDNFYGVNRSVNSRLYGIGYDSSQLSLREGLTNAVAEIYTVGGQPDAIFLSPQRYAQLQLQLQTGALAQKMPEDGDFGFKKVELVTDFGSIPVYADRWCPNAYGFVLEMDSWKLMSVGDVPQIVDEDGKMLFRSATLDAFEVRLAAYVVPACARPNHNAIVKLP